MFSERDTFIGMHAIFKEELLIGKDEYLRVIESCKRTWRILFSPYDPNLGDKTDDYITRFYPV
jgi:hypothetical protein